MATSIKVYFGVQSSYFGKNVIDLKQWSIILQSVDWGQNNVQWLFDSKKYKHHLTSLVACCTCTVTMWLWWCFAWKREVTRNSLNTQRNQPVTAPGWIRSVAAAACVLFPDHVQLMLIVWHVQKTAMCSAACSMGLWPGGEHHVVNDG